MIFDIMIFESGNGGDFNIRNGDLDSVKGLTNQPYLAHFGGNKEASTTGEEIPGKERFDWWGNSFFQNEPGAQMNSELERGLRNQPLNSKGRVQLERFAKEDLEFLTEVAEVDSEVSIIGNDKIKISDKLKEPNAENQYSVLWEATKNEQIEQKII